MHRFFCAESLVQGAAVTLSPEESHHLAGVLRARPGEKVMLVDGRGALAVACLERVNRGGVVALVESVEVVAARNRVWIVFALPKSAALEFLLHRGTEIGVAGFQPLQTRFSLRADGFNRKRCERLVAQSAKQCEESHFPSLRDPLPLADWLARREPGALLSCDEGIREARPVAPATGTACFVVTGAEGGWDEGEREQLRGSGASSLGLGANRLRAETAALVAAVLAKRLIGEL